MEIYPGKQPEGLYRQSNSTHEVVIRLTEPVHNTDRTIVMDNFFTNLSTITLLKNERNLSVAGMVNKNKP